MLETLESYIYTGVSFSTFSFDRVSLNCIKYKLSFFRKPYYLSLIKKELAKEPFYLNDVYSVKYFIKSTLNSLSNASLLMNPNLEQIKLVKRLLKRKDVLYSSAFKIVDLSSEIKIKPVCFVLNDRNDYNKYLYIIENFKDVRFIYLEDIYNELKSKTNSQTIFDEVKLKILQDNDSEAFFIDMKIFTNLINDFIFTLNKIAINLY